MATRRLAIAFLAQSGVNAARRYQPLRDAPKPRTIIVAIVIDFLVVRDRQPWFLVEVKLTDTTLSPSLTYFQAQTKVPHVFQVVMNQPYEPSDCFKVHRPMVVPAKTFLSQLL